MPEGWAWCKIEEIAESNIGLTYKPEDVCSDGIPVLRSNNIKNRRICTDGLIRVKTHILPKQFIGKGDLLICARNGSRNLVGKCALIEQDEEPMSFGAFMAVCRSAFNRWIFLILNSSYFNQYLDNSNSTAINQVTQSMLLSFNIPLPPKNERARIYSMVERLCSCVDELEKHEQVVLAKINDSRKRILELAIHGKLVPQDPTEEPAIELLKRINPAFEPSHNLHYEECLPSGWVYATLGEISDYGHCVSVSTDEIAETEWVLELEDIEKDTGRLLKKVIKSERAISGSRHVFYKGQVLYSKLRTYLNKVFVAEDCGFCTTEIIPITPKDGITAEYLNMYLRSPLFLAYTEQCGYGVKMPRLGTSDARKAIVPVPPTMEQHRIVTVTKQLFAQIDALADNL